MPGPAMPTLDFCCVRVVLYPGMAAVRACPVAAEGGHVLWQPPAASRALQPVVMGNRRPVPPASLAGIPGSFAYNYSARTLIH